MCTILHRNRREWIYFLLVIAGFWRHLESQSYQPKIEGSPGLQPTSALQWVMFCYLKRTVQDLILGTIINMVLVYSTEKNHIGQNMFSGHPAIQCLTLLKTPVKMCKQFLRRHKPMKLYEINEPLRCIYYTKFTCIVCYTVNV